MWVRDASRALELQGGGDHKRSAARDLSRASCDTLQHTVGGALALLVRIPLFALALQCKCPRSMVEYAADADVCAHIVRCRPAYDIIAQQAMSLVLKRSGNSRHVQWYKAGHSNTEWSVEKQYRIFHRGGVLEYTADADACMPITLCRPMHGVKSKQYRQTRNSTLMTMRQTHMLRG